ncbi:MAG: patatin family protein [Ruminococcaceae bacterium]|nr:patatin family protein [Oscillospiraceae bacterium]
MKLGLVVEGGASRVYFSTGVMDFLLEKNIRADYVVGVSAGIANAASYISGQLGRNLQVGTNFLTDKRYMGMRHLLNPKKRSYYNIDFVFGGIMDYVPFDFDGYNASGCQATAVVTNLSTGKAEYIDVSHHNGDWTPMIASCSLPIMFQPVKMGDSLYLDGGIADPIPVNRAIEDGCDKIIVITTREREFKKTKESGVGLSSLIYKKYPNFVSLLKNRATLYNEARDNVLQLEKQGKILLISPENTDGWRRTESNPDLIRQFHSAGYEIAKAKYEEIVNYIGK